MCECVDMCECVYMCECVHVFEVIVFVHHMCVNLETCDQNDLCCVCMCVCVVCACVLCVVCGHLGLLLIFLW